jgi:phospholipase A-2-activating protein
LIPSEAAPQAEREAFASLSAEASADKEQVDPNTVPSESEMHRSPGKKVGDIKMFKDASNVVYAYQWTALRAWEKVGLVTGSGGGKKKLKKTYGGDQYFNPGEYEYIFDVELGEGRMALLPFNEGDNPLVTAEKFCAREGINKANISQIIDFIKTNTNGTSCAASTQSAVTRTFPLSSPYLFKEAKWPQLLSKLHEVNNSLPEHSRLTNVEMNVIESVVELLQKPPSNTNPDLRPVEIQIVHSTLISRFPPESLFVVFDLWRMFVLNSAACVMYKDSNGGSQYMMTAARYLEQNSTNNTGLCCARYLSNLFSQSVPKWAAVENQKLFVFSLVHALSTSEGVSKNTQMACAAALANLASATTEKATAKSVELAQSLADSIMAILHSGISRFDPEVLGRLLVALGCCIVGARSGLDSRKHEFQLMLQEVERSGKSDPVISEIRQVII